MGALRVEQLVISRQHKECPNRDPVQGHCEVGPPDTSEQQIHHGPSPPRFGITRCAARTGSSAATLWLISSRDTTGPSGRLGIVSDKRNRMLRGPSSFVEVSGSPMRRRS